jgi:hypothetical protein
MSLGRAAALAVIPWVIVLAIIAAYHVWTGMPGEYGWPNFLQRMAWVAVILYGAFTWAFHESMPHTRGRDPVEKP